MKTVLATLLTTTSVYAADLSGFPTKAPPIAPIMMDPWTGFYVGFNGGYGWGSHSSDPNFLTVNGAPVPLLGQEPSPTGGVFGAQAGYNWQIRQVWVAGLELDYDAASLSTTQNISFQNATITGTSKVDALGSVRARVGYLWAPDLLIYGTAGLGYGHVTDTFDEVFVGRQVELGEHAAQNMFGWVAGGGLEWHVPNTPVFVRGEYLHFDFNSQTPSWPLSPAGNIGLDTTGKSAVDVVRGALSYKF